MMSNLISRNVLIYVIPTIIVFASAYLFCKKRKKKNEKCFSLINDLSTNNKDLEKENFLVNKTISCVLQNSDKTHNTEETSLIDNVDLSQPCSEHLSNNESASKMKIEIEEISNSMNQLDINNDKEHDSDPLFNYISLNNAAEHCSLFSKENTIVSDIKNEAAEFDVNDMPVNLESGTLLTEIENDSEINISLNKTYNHHNLEKKLNINSNENPVIDSIELAQNEVDFSSSEPEPLNFLDSVSEVMEVNIIQTNLPNIDYIQENDIKPLKKLINNDMTDSILIDDISFKQEASEDAKLLNATLEIPDNQKNKSHLLEENSKISNHTQNIEVNYILDDKITNLIETLEFQEHNLNSKFSIKDQNEVNSDNLISSESDMLDNLETFYDDHNQNNATKTSVKDQDNISEGIKSCERNYDIKNSDNTSPDTLSSAQSESSSLDLGLEKSLFHNDLISSENSYRDLCANYKFQDLPSAIHHNKIGSPLVMGMKLCATSPYVYEFELPQELCGRLIGKGGRHIKQLKERSNTNVFIKSHPYDPSMQVVAVEGSKSEVNNALELIRRKYPPSQFPSVTLTQTNLIRSLRAPNSEPPQLHLPDGVSCIVKLSSLDTAGHFFLQQPSHPTYSSLETLGQLMLNCYEQGNAPFMPQPVEAGVVCAAPLIDGWYRVQIIFVYDNGIDCRVKFVDYGGHSNMPINSLRQIRSDFMTLPFQATECYLANVRPLDIDLGWTPEATAFFEELAQDKKLEACVVNYAEDGLPCVNLYKVDEVSTLLINKELVENGFAAWCLHN